MEFWSTSDCYTCVALIVGLASYWFYHFNRTDVNGPFEFPFLGTLSMLRNYNRFLDWSLEMTHIYGPTWVCSIGLQRNIMISLPEDVEHILSANFDNYTKGPPFQSRFQELLGDGIFNADGALWYNQRKTALHIFATRELRNIMVPTFLEHAKTVIKQLHTAAETGQVVDLQDVFMRYTLDSIAKIAFGLSIGALEAGRDPPEFARAFDRAQLITNKRCFSAWWQVQRFLNRGDEADFAECIRILNEFATNVIQQRRLELENSRDAPEDHSDLLSRFMATTDEEGNPPTDEFLRDVMLNYLIAGRDTTAVALSWTTWLLATHPCAATRVHEEAIAVLGRYGEPTYDVLKNMNYLHSVFSESLRLYPPVPKDPKFAVSADTLPSGIKVPAGSLVTYQAFVMGRMDSLWENAHSFTPERWLNDDGSLSPPPSNFKFTAFQAGKRICLGRLMAYTEAKTLLSLIFREFDLKVVPNHPVEPNQAAVVLPMKYGLKMTVHRRNQTF
eukprot:Rmarinus@m.16684